MGNRLPEWLRPKCPISVARKLGGTTRRQHMGEDGYQKLGRIASKASIASLGPEGVAASCANARAGRALLLWRGAGYAVSVPPPMSYVSFRVLLAVRGRPGIHSRGIARLFRLYDRSVLFSSHALIEKGMLKHCAPSMPGHGVRHGLDITVLGLAALERIETLLEGTRHG